MQLNQNFEPFTEHLAIACSTNERGIRATKKRLIVAKASGDIEKAKEYRAKLTQQQKQIEKFCKDNDLRRQTEREMVQEEY